LDRCPDLELKGFIFYDRLSPAGGFLLQRNPEILLVSKKENGIFFGEA